MAVTYHCLGDNGQKTFVHVWCRPKNISNLWLKPFNMKIVDLESGPLSHNQRNAGVHSLLVFLFWWCIKSCLFLLRGVLEWVEGRDPPACSSWAGPLKKCIPWWIWEHGHRRHWLRTHSNKYRGPGVIQLSPQLQGLHSKFLHPKDLSPRVSNVRASNFLYEQTAFSIIYRWSSHGWGCRQDVWERIHLG